MKLFTTAAAIALTATASFADTYRATITKIEPNYGYRQVSVPNTVCQNVDVPIYGTVQGGGASGGDVLGGMILGALLGKGVGGNDKGAAAGAGETRAQAHGGGAREPLAPHLHAGDRAQGVARAAVERHEGVDDRHDRGL